MKKGIIGIVLALVLLLPGCAAEPVYETIGDVWANSEPVTTPGTMDFALPDGARMEVLEEETDTKSYTVGEWEIWTQVCPGGDILATMEQVTGLRGETLTVLQRQAKNMTCHETAWSTTGENGIKVGRTGVLDDGNYHYCISVMVPEADAAEVGDFFTQIFDSVTINDTAP